MLRTRDLTVRLRRRRVLEPFTAEFPPGVNGLIGPNGAGKTTLLRVLATVTAPTSGTVQWPATDLREIRRGIGYLPQDFGHYPRFTAWEFVEHFAWLKEIPAADLPGAVDRALERVGLADRADERLGRLSGGMRQRVGIAQAIVNRPAVLLLDEPDAGLDPEQRADFRVLLRELGQESCVVVSTHVIEDVEKACDRVWVLDGGREVFSGTPAQLGDDVGRGYHAVLASGREQVA